MTTDRDFDRIALAWLAEGPEELSDRVLDAVVDDIHVTRQRHGARRPRRFESMTTFARVAAAAVIGVIAIGGALYAFAPVGSGGRGPTPSPTPSPTASPTASPSFAGIVPEVPLLAGRYMETPFGPGGMDACYGQTGCTEDPADETMRFMLTVPEGWVGGSVHTIYLADGGKAAPRGAGLVISRGGGLYAEPCGDEPPPNIPVGPTVDDFVNALGRHPKLEVTSPVDITLAGYEGKYLDLLVPDDITACPSAYFPWEPGIYAQGPGSRWHLWVIDVQGIRVVVQTTDYDGTDPARQAELQAIVDSITIEP